MNISGSGKYRKKIRRAPSLYYRPSKKPEKTTRINWKLFWFFVKTFCPLLVIAYVLFISSTFRIKDVIVSGNEFVTSEKIINAIPNNSNILTMKSTTIEDQIKEQIPEIKQIKIYKGIPDAIKVIVIEYKGALIWQSGINYYLVSDNGIVFRDITNNIADYASLPKVNDLRSLPVKISNRMVSTDFVDFAKYIYGSVKEVDNLDPDYFTIDETTVDMNLITKNNMYIKFDTLRSSEKQLNDLKLVLMEKKSEVTEYIDLRVSGWAYFK